MRTNTPTYVLGTGLSHDGSAVLLRDGRVCFGIEKERLTRLKHDGGNDNEVIQYCLDAEGISLADISVVVQCENFNRPPRDSHHGRRILGDYPNTPLVDISHHLAHAYSVVGTAPFETFPVLVIDGCGSPIDQCIDLSDAGMPATVRRDSPQFLLEKDSFYFYDGKNLRALFKDFSDVAPVEAFPAANVFTSSHSIGGFYAILSSYCFRGHQDAGKLMGLAPFGNRDVYTEPAFRFDGERLMMTDGWYKYLVKEAENYTEFQANFQHYADLATWAQHAVEEAVLGVVERRLRQHPSNRLCYTGGVALNAVANAKILSSGLVDELYVEPAAGDNGIALGCAFYGWLEYLGRERVRHDGGTCFGKRYSKADCDAVFESSQPSSITCQSFEVSADLVERVADSLVDGKVVGWFRGGSEFGPRALGRRSILAHPGIRGMQKHINQNIKNREDFRPFAPSVLLEDAPCYFTNGRESPYMILVDQVRPEWKDQLSQVVHLDDSARVQTVSRKSNPTYYQLIEAFKRKTGLGVVLNTSFNTKGMPIVETPAEAMELFLSSKMDVLVLEDRVFAKRAV